MFNAVFSGETNRVKERRFDFLSSDEDRDATVDEVVGEKEESDGDNSARLLGDASGCSFDGGSESNLSPCI